MKMNVYVVKTAVDLKMLMLMMSYLKDGHQAPFISSMATAHGGVEHPPREGASWNSTSGTACLKATPSREVFESAFN